MSKGILLALLAAATLACAPSDGGGEPADTASTSAPVAPSPDTSAGAPGAAPHDETRLDFPRDSGTTGISQRSRGGIAPVILRAVRAARHDDFDRVVFEFDGTEVPGYHVEYIDRPVRQCGSGDPMQVAGDGWLAVRLEPAYAHEGETTVTATVRDRDRTLDLPNLRQLVLTCDFEAQVEWVLGLRSPNRYRVRELTDPGRLVVDVRH